MTKFTKKLCLTLCIFAGLLLSTLGISTIKMPTVQASSATSFNMIDAASLRVSGENNGLRFCAEIGTELYSTVTNTDGAYFGMIIIPDEYRTTYKAQIEETYDYVTVLKTAGATLLNIENIIPYEYDSDKDEVVDAYRMNGVISNVRYYNLNYDFVGIAYYYVPGDGYHYVDNHQTVSVQNVYDVAMRVLYRSETYDAVTGMTATALGYLDEYKFLAEQQAIGAEQPDDTAIATYKANMTANRQAFDGETVDFNSDENISLVSKGIYTTNRASGIEIVDDGTTSYLKFNAKYASVNVSFPKPIEVYSDTIITLKLKGVAANDGTWLKLQKYGTVGSAGLTLQNYGYVSGDTWTTANVSASALGYVAGDLLTGVQLQFAGDTLTDGSTSSAYVDYITVSSIEVIRAKLAKGLTGEQVANFDDADYSKLVTLGGTGTTSIIENGVLTVTSSNWAKQTINFVTPKTVTDGDFIIIRLQANGRVTAVKKNGTEYVELVHSNPNNNYPAVACSTEMQTVYLPVYMLGYAKGETISSIKISWHNEASGTFVVDYIEYHNANLATNVVADYTDETLGVALASRQPYYYYTLLNNSPYAYGKAETRSYDSEKGATVISTTGNYKAVRIMLQKPVTVTENTKFTVTLSCDTESLRMRGLIKDNGCYDSLNPKGSNFSPPMYMDGNFYSIGFMATKSYSVGETVTYLEFMFSSGSLAIKTITAYEVA